MPRRKTTAKERSQTDALEMLMYQISSELDSIGKSLETIADAVLMIANSQLHRKIPEYHPPPYGTPIGGVWGVL
jgi:hypothetical protein